jgi:hypothetical protein
MQVFSTSDFHGQWVDDNGVLVLASEQLAKYPVRDSVKVRARAHSVCLSVSLCACAYVSGSVSVGACG